MYLCKRKVNKFRNIGIIIFLNLVIIGCSFSPVNPNFQITVSKFKFDISIPEKIKNNLNKLIKKNETSNKEIILKEFEFKESSFYGGKNLGSLETEIVGSVQIQILNGEEHTKKISSSRRFRTQNLNPLAQKELIKTINIEIIEDLNKKIILYLKTYENK